MKIFVSYRRNDRRRDAPVHAGGELAESPVEELGGATPAGGPGGDEGRAR
jgi:hypothetical protein